MCAVYLCSIGHPTLKWLLVFFCIKTLIKELLLYSIRNFCCVTVSIRMKTIEDCVMHKTRAVFVDNVNENCTVTCSNFERCSAL